MHLVYLPLFHTNALAYSMLATLWVGGTLRDPAAVFAPAGSGTSRCATTAPGPRLIGPFCMKALLDHEIPKDHSYRLWGTAVSIRRRSRAFGVKTIGWWGMTETITHGIVGELDQPNIADVDRPRGARISDPRRRRRRRADRGRRHRRSADPGHSRPVAVRRISHNEKATRESFDEHGYFITGDRVTLLDNGFIRFGDRAKDMLKVGGENVAASEIEQVIAVVPGVREAAVVAKKHPMLDEVPVVFIIPMAGVDGAPPDLHDTVMAACRARSPTSRCRARFTLVDDMPRSTLEKVAKAELRKLLG